MQLRRKMVLIVIASIVLTAVPGAALIYHYAQGNIRESKAVELEKTTAASSALAMQRFAQSEPKLAALAHVLQWELAQPIRPGEIEAFHESVERYPDGVWRNRRSGYEGSNEAGMFLPPNTKESDAQKILHLRIKRIMDVFGAAASKPLENVWYLSPQRSEVIFDRNLAEFVFEMKADTDYTQTPWLTYTSPQLNPKRQLRFTPPLFDPVPRVWMVSAIYPLYVNGQWLGSLGEDLPLSGVLNSLFAQGQLIHGAQRFLLDREGNFVLAGPWQRQLESNPGAFHSELNRERQLTELMQLPLTDSPHLLNDEVVVQGRRYMAIGARLEPVDWRFYSLTPVDEIIAPTRRLFLAMVGMILLVAAVSGAMIATAVGAGITRRIRMLSDVMKGYTKDHQLRVNEIKIGNDEIAEVALVYNHMADDIDQNIAQRLDAERALTKSEELWRFALEGSGDGVWDMDLINKTVVRTRRWKEMLGYSEEEIGDSFDEWVTRVHPDDLVRVSVDDVRSGANDALTSQYRMRCKDGSYIWILDRSMVVRQDVDGNSTRVVGTIHDISDLKNQAAHIQKLAFYDTLTGLPNRALFLDRLEQILATAMRRGNHGAILFLDLDRFKEINDSQGHAIGDLALAEVARRLLGVVREEETLARLGGDEFVLIAENADHETAVWIAMRMQNALAPTLDLLGQSHSIGASIGIALYPEDGQTSEDLIKHTDIAMYRAKASGGGYCLYQAAMGDALGKRVDIAQRLALAIKGDLLQLYFQPQIDLGSGRAIGAEVMLRWNDSGLGWISPSEFIPIAEDRGMMSTLGDWVVKQSCRQLVLWADAGLKLGGRLAINVSARQLEDPGIVDRLIAIVREAKLSPDMFELEITESSMMIDPERAVKVMDSLSAAGFSLSIDDFGTGYSSLAYLKRFSVSQIKIDISFVRGMLTDANDHAIVTTIIAMARSLGLHTTAEGVEQAAQATALRALGCNFAQGYHFARPEPADSFMKTWLEPSRPGESE